MKQGRKLSVNERKHISKSITRVEDWFISKKETELWTVIHKGTGQAKQILSP
jgi:hypothetical protein